eukprot:TRINITY_DN18923_c0_g1_i1.p1 TRINITY_DN18923_c0_g1~~TRINITY_DN18923_c0_g1_i1.p1  ORF type:complete len:182 (+),score=42.85 TRINITY_DN18923_c0_g1_i1:212-757(+)
MPSSSSTSTTHDNSSSNPHSNVNTPPTMVPASSTPTQKSNPLNRNYVSTTTISSSHRVDVSVPPRRHTGTPSQLAALPVREREDTVAPIDFRKEGGGDGGCGRTNNANMSSFSDDDEYGGAAKPIQGDLGYSTQHFHESGHTNNSDYQGSLCDNDSGIFNINNYFYAVSYTHLTLPTKRIV